MKRPAEQGVLNALALTLSQFKGVREVRISVEGKEGVISLPSWMPDPPTACSG